MSKGEQPYLGSFCLYKTKPKMKYHLKLQSSISSSIFSSSLSYQIQLNKKTEKLTDLTEASESSPAITTLTS